MKRIYWIIIIVLILAGLSFVLPDPNCDIGWGWRFSC